MKLICIEGNIGAGKSTLTKDLAALLDALPMYEPVGENPYLDKFYQDPKRYALEMQFWLMSNRFQMHEKAIRHIWTTGQTVIMDRSIYGDWVFAKKNHQDGNIDFTGYANYLAHRSVMDKFLLIPHTMIFLNVPVAVCKTRIAQRGRDCEKTIPREYLTGLEVLHEQLKDEMRVKGSEIMNVNWESFYPAADIAEKILRERT